MPREDILAGAVKGAYVVLDTADANLIIMATGSEVGLALEVAAKLKGYRVRVVSMPCWELFQAQPAAYLEAILPAHKRQRVSIEAGITLGWERFVGLDGLAIGIDHYGASAPAEVLAEQYGFTAAKICERIQTHFA